MEGTLRLLHCGALASDFEMPFPTWICVGHARQGKFSVLLFLLDAISRPFRCLKFGLNLAFVFCEFGSYLFSRGSSVPTFVQREGEIISD